VFIFFLVIYGKSVIWSLWALDNGLPAFYEAFVEHQEWYVKSSSSGIIFSIIAFLRNMDHGLVTVYLSLTNPDIYESPRLFFDWPRAFLELIPGISQPEFIVSNTPSGLNRDFFNNDGYIPPGWVAMKIINGGILWLFLGSLFAGFIGGYLNKLLYLNWNSSPIIPGLFIYFAFFWKDYIVGTDPFMFVLPNIVTFLILFLLSFIIIFKNRKGVVS